MSENKEDKTQDTEAPQDQAGASQVNLNEVELAALCKAHVCVKCAVMAEAEDIKLRALADNENFKRRIQRETEELRRYSTESVRRLFQSGV